MRVCIRTYGCQMNARDSESLAVLLRTAGHELVDSESAAEAVVINTCSIRNKAEEKAIGTMRQIASSRKGRRGRIVGAVGCMAQRLGGELLESVKGLDFVIGTHRLASLPAVLAAVAAGEGPVVDIAGEEMSPASLLGHEKGKITAFVTVLEGCNRGCTYCIVPAVRGPEVSRPAAEVVEEVRSLVADGVREVTLIGQSVTSYGRVGGDMFAGLPPSRAGFAEPLPRLLEEVSSVPGIARIRFASSHPSGCTDELVCAMARPGPVCEHLHLPVQSGSDRILRAMRRGYTAAGYLAAVAGLRRGVPGIAVTTDIIVGFPGETDDDFEQTRALMRDAGFDNAFVFKYSPRPGTSASDLGDDVKYAEKVRRNRVLLEDQEARGLEINRRLEGTVVEVLVEGESPRKKERWFGRSRSNKIVIFEPVPGLRAGDLAQVLVERARPQTLHGKIADVTGRGDAER